LAALQNLKSRVPNASPLPMGARAAEFFPSPAEPDKHWQDSTRRLLPSRGTSMECSLLPDSVLTHLKNANAIRHELWRSI
jgi:hypothetical protein